MPRRPCGAMERGKHVYVQKPLVRTVWEARQLRAGGRQVQGGHPDGQPGLFQRRHAAVRRDRLERRYRQRHRSARLERPADVAAGPYRDSQRGSGSVHSGLGPLARHRRQAALHGGRQDRARQERRLLLPAVQLARLLRFRLRRPGRYGLPHPGRAQHGAASFQSQGHQRRVHQEGRRQPLHVPQGFGHPLRFRRLTATCRR